MIEVVLSENPSFNYEVSVLGSPIDVLIEDGSYGISVEANQNRNAEIIIQETFDKIIEINIGKPGPAASAVPRLIAVFDTDLITQPGDLVHIGGENYVEKIYDNLSATIPNGVFGIGYEKPSTLQIGVLFVGIMGGYSGFTAGLPLFISTSGTPTHTVPSTGMVQQIGFAISATEMFVNLMQPMRRI